MKDTTIIKLVRLAGGIALLITHAVTGYDGVMLGVGLFLLGVPAELAKKEEEITKETA